MDIQIKNKKLLFFIPRMGGGGAERVMATLANTLAERNYEITIATLIDRESFYPLNTKISVIAAGYKINRKNRVISMLDQLFKGIASLRYINRCINEQRPDVILSFLTHTNILSLIVHKFHRKIPIFVSERSDPSVRLGIIQTLCKMLYASADCIICQSNKVADFYAVNGKAKTTVIANPIDTDSIPTNDIAVRKKIVVAVGRLFPEKNFSLLIDSFSDISSEFSDYNLEIYGEGPLREELQGKIDNYNLHDRIVLMGTRKKVMHYINDASLFVMSSDYEGFPNALLEAMASGLPVVSTDFYTGTASDLVGKENGLIVPTKDRRALAQAIRTILSNTDLQNSMSKENKKMLETLRAENIIEEWENVFRMSLKKRTDAKMQR